MTRFVLAYDIGPIIPPQDDGCCGPYYSTYPIGSTDSILVQKIIDTNHLRLQVSNIATANENSRVRSLQLNLYWCDSSNTPDTFVIPELICGLEELESFTVQNSLVKYVQIPQKGSCVSNVTSLKLMENRLSAIPPNLSFFEQLYELRLDGNLIDTISVAHSFSSPSRPALMRLEEATSSVFAHSHVGYWLFTSKVFSVVCMIRLIRNHWK